MALCNIQPWILRAKHEHFAIGAFNANTMEQVQAIVQAAQQESAPSIVQVSHHALLYVGSGNATLGLRYMAEIGRVAAESVTVPISLHLDHACESEVLEALALGFTSVMFDGADLPLEKNIDLTQNLCKAAHSVGACIEAELGEVPRADASGKADHVADMTRPEDAALFVRETGIDMLAISIGSVHAIRQKSIALDIDRLKAVRAAVDIPLVLHGSSGVTDHFIADGIALGLSKINVATQLNQAFTRAVRSKLAEDSSEVDPRKYLSMARDAMKEHVRERIRFFGAAGRARSRKHKKL
jgi:fructose-bisphosphate aldolase, class II